MMGKLSIPYLRNSITVPLCWTDPMPTPNFGDVFKAARSATDPDFVATSDLKPYFPSYEAPAGFLASPIFHDGKNVGVSYFSDPCRKN